MIKVKRAKEFSNELAVGMGKLMPALSSKMDDSPVPRQVIERITNSDHHQLFVAYDEDRIVGTAVLSLVMGIDKNFQDGPNAYLESFVVDSSIQGKGIGSIIWDDMVAWCKEESVNKMEFTSNAKRVSAHNFYAKKGAKIYETCFFQLPFEN